MEQHLTRPDVFEIRPIRRPRRSLPAAPSVSRARLVQRLEEAARSRFVLLAAPAGWGKSSALADWANATGRSVAWVSCQSWHNEPGRFFQALAEAIEGAGANMSADVVAMLRSPRPMPADQVVSVVTDELSSQRHPIVLVLDDFHLVLAPVVREMVFALATQGPHELTVVVSGRDMPDWPLARLRAHGQVVELGVADLAFDVGDIAALFDGMADAAFYKTLADQSEGWAAGIHLARLWLRDDNDAASVLRAFQGTHRDIADYLAEEVVGRLSEELKWFLVATSVPDSFTASLAGEIAGVEDADRMLREIEQRSLFLLPLDHERLWYRYHGVFRQFLRTRFRQLDQAEENRINSAVSRWHEREGNLVEAVTYALRAGDFGRAAGLLDGVAEHLLLQRGEAHTLLRLVEQLPEEAIGERPSLRQFHAWALVLLGRLDEAAAIADRLASRQSEMGAEISGIRARIAAYRGDQGETIARAEAALSDDGAHTHWFRADTLLSLGFAYRVVGRIDEALDAFTQASAAGWDCGFAHGALWGTRYQAITLVSQGRLREASDLIEHGLQRATDSGLDHGAALAALLIGRGEIRYERNDLRGAREDLERGLAIAQGVGDAKILMNAYVAMSMLEQAAGNDELARRHARRATLVFDGTGEKATAAWIALRQGDLAMVTRWMNHYVREVGMEPDLCVGETEQIMLGRAMLVTGDIDGGRAFLETLLRQAEDSGRFGRAITIHLLLAQSASARGSEGPAFRHLSEAVTIASGEEFCRAILDEGPDVLNLLREWASRGHASQQDRQYVLRVLAFARDGEDGSGASAGLIESLTPRQMEVMRLMVDGLSNRDIASRLFVSEGTVKAHVHQIYGKLMVRNRVEALRAARDLNLT